MDKRKHCYNLQKYQNYQVYPIFINYYQNGKNALFQILDSLLRKKWPKKPDKHEGDVSMTFIFKLIKEIILDFFFPKSNQFKSINSLK